MYFFKDYDEYSRVATMLSRIGGICYLAAVFCLVAPMMDKTIDGQEEYVLFVIFLIAGLLLNYWAKCICKKKIKEKNNELEVNNIYNNNENLKSNSNRVVKKVDVSDSEPSLNRPVKSEIKKINVSFGNNEDDIEEDDDDDDFVTIVNPNKKTKVAERKSKKETIKKTTKRSSK